MYIRNRSCTFHAIHALSNTRSETPETHKLYKLCKYTFRTMSIRERRTEVFDMCCMFTKRYEKLNDQKKFDELLKNKQKAKECVDECEVQH